MPAFGDCEGKRSGLSDFGAAALGDGLDKLPKDVERLPHCVVYDRKRADCEFLDKSGVSYVVFGDLITRKNIRISRRGSPTKLPFGLTPADTVENIVKKLSARADAPDPHILYRDKKLELFSGLCMTDTRGERFAIEFIFGNAGRLEEMSVLADSPGN